jgi:hypothetical protein
MLDGIDSGRAEPVGVGLSSQVLAPNPAGICVRGLNAEPPAALLDHAEGLAGKRLRDLLGTLCRLGSERRELACERMFA